MTKNELINEIKKYKAGKERNSMGCLESWYDYVFAFKETFSIEEIEEMNEVEIEHLVRLATNIQEGLY